MEKQAVEQCLQKLLPCGLSFVYPQRMDGSNSLHLCQISRTITKK